MNPADPSTDISAAEKQYVDSGSLLPFVLAGAVLVALLYGGWKWYQVRQFQAAQANELPASRMRIPLTDFELAERSGKPFRSAEMRGKVWVTSYFFSSCIGTCLTLNENIARLNARPELADVTWVSITCDPDNDTLDVLSEYAKKWNADPDRWLFCRGDFEYTKGIARGMNLALAMKMHADHAAVIDKAGKIRGLFDATSRYQCDRMRALLLECLAEPAPTGGPVKETVAADSSSRDS
jgi:cytochrome oxidase Cu insertion factor (SCO1/SenC/PrrC family)